MKLVTDLRAGDQYALAQVITEIENRSPGYRDIVSELYGLGGDAEIIGITGSPGTGKSTLVDRLIRTYRERGETVGVIAVDPVSPFTGGSVLGDRTRMRSRVMDEGVFIRSMSTRGSLGGLSASTMEAIRALDAFGKDVVIVETVGAGQNDVDIVRTADTVTVVLTPLAGDDIQMLKAGILEIADVFVVNKADLDGVDQTVRDLRELIELSDGSMGSHLIDSNLESEVLWEPRIIETVATTGVGIDALVDVYDQHQVFLDESGVRTRKERVRYAEEIRVLLQEDIGRVTESYIDAMGGMNVVVDSVLAGTTDPYEIAAKVMRQFDVSDRETDVENELY